MARREFFGHNWCVSPLNLANHPTSDQNRYSRQPVYHSISYTLLFSLKHTEKGWKLQQPIAAPLLFTMDQLIAVLWRYGNTNCDVI